MADRSDVEAARAAARRMPAGGRLAIALGVADLAAAAFYALRDDRPAARSVTLTGIQATVIAEGSSDQEIESLRSGAVDFALVSAVHRGSHRDPGVRIAAALHMEALHLLVRPELAAQASDGLDGLRGRSVSLGPDGSAGAELAAQLCEFAGLRPLGAASPDGFRSVRVGIDELLALLDGGQLAALPDAIFHLATMPSLIAQRLVREAGYVLVPLPFVEAFRMQAILSDDAMGGAEHAGIRRLVADVDIPPFLYRARPAVPADPLPTLGARLLLLTHERVADATVERVLGAIYETRLSRMLHPTLDRSLLATTPRRELHDGIVEIELAATLDRDTLIPVQRDLLQLKSEVLDRFTDGALDDQALSGLLASINAAREHVGELQLHVRAHLEERAQIEGRESSAVWNEAASGDEPAAS